MYSTPISMRSPIRFLSRRTTASVHGALWCSRNATRAPGNTRFEFTILPRSLQPDSLRSFICQAKPCTPDSPAIPAES